MKNRKNIVNVNNNELISLLIYALRANKKSTLDKKSIIHSIILEYKIICDDFQKTFVEDNLDTFKRAACLLVAINRKGFSRNKMLNASIAVDAACKMCEKPYTFVGINSDQPFQLEEINLNEIFWNDMALYTDFKGSIVNSLLYDKKGPINYYLMLEDFYKKALAKKHQRIDTEVSATNTFFPDNNWFSTEMGQNSPKKRGR